MNKTTIYAVVLFLLAVIIFQPYTTFTEYKTALVTKDISSLSEVVDFPTLRTNVKEQLTANIMSKLPYDTPGDVVTVHMATTILDEMVDKMFTPAGLIAAMVDNKKDVTVDGMFKDAEFDITFPYKFTVTSKNLKGDDVVFVFKRTSGLLDGFFRYKLVNIILPL